MSAEVTRSVHCIQHTHTQRERESKGCLQML
eukprot:COSAG05_NODE_13615_length_423_cov_1.114198_1_plen_30_part_10